MSEKYEEYCMKFSKKELKDIFCGKFNEELCSKIICITGDGSKIDFDSDGRIETIAFDENENLAIMFWEYQTSIYVCGKELMSQDEIAVMDGGKCIMQLRGVRPFFSNKFDITKHKQYRLLSDFDDKNALDIEKYVKNLCKAKVRDNDTVDEVEDAGVIEA